VLDQIVRERGAGPELVRMDNGPEMTANALRDWCRFSGAGRSFIEPGSLWQDPFVESFGSRVRDEVSSVEAFDSVIEAHTVINDWKDIDNNQRPYSRHGRRSPAAFRRYRDRRSPARPTPTVIAAAGPTNGPRHPGSLLY
jgi:putative transposase